MSDVNWDAIALECGRSIGELERGVFRISRAGFYVLFVPVRERPRVERDLAKAGIAIHGVSIQTSDDGGKVFAAVVKADNHEKLRMIAHGLTKS